MGCTAQVLFHLIAGNVCSSTEISKIEKGGIEVPSNDDNNIIKCYVSIKCFLVLNLFLTQGVHLVLHLCTCMDVGLYQNMNMGASKGLHF